MVALASHGIKADIPPGWDARIYRRGDAVVASGAAAAARHAGGTTHAILHAASFPLPLERGDFGSGAVEIMQSDDVLVVLIEYHPDAASTAMFRASGLPRSLHPRAFSPTILQRMLPGQAGTQVFFNEAGRAWCLYVVLGSFADRARLVARVNALLSTIDLGTGGGA